MGSLVIGFHGCDLGVARRVISKGGELNPSRNKWDWLGHGIYFWEESEARARRWAMDEFRRGKIKVPTVIGAAIDLGYCLNLTSTESLELVRNAYSAYTELCTASGLSPARNRGSELGARFLDCAVIETLHKLRLEERKQDFDTVRCFFVEGRTLYSGAGFRELDHVQICVRNPRQIVGYFWPRGSENVRI